MKEQLAHQRCMEQISAFMVREYGCGLEVVPVGMRDELEFLLFELSYCCQFPEKGFKNNDPGYEPDYNINI